MTSASAIATALADACPEPFVAVDAAPRVLAWNRPATRLLGWSAAELVGSARPVLGSAAELRAAARGGEAVEGALVLPWARKAGPPVIGAVEGGEPIRTPDGAVVGWGGRLRRATREELEARLVALEERDRSVPRRSLRRPTTSRRRSRGCAASRARCAASVKRCPTRSAAPTSRAWSARSVGSRGSSTTSSSACGSRRTTSVPTRSRSWTSAPSPVPCRRSSVPGRGSGCA